MGDSAVLSAPGKVLLAGGYLVLDRDYTGLVFGLDARIHVHVQRVPTSDGVSLSEVIVRSPQFEDALWRYGYRLTEVAGGVEVTQLTGNPFVETALTYALAYISAVTSVKIEPASITILADDDYYSSTRSLEGKSPWMPRDGQFRSFHVSLQDAHKTGLGSSAALVTAFTAAVLTHYLPSSVFSIANRDGKARLHNLAQAAHCAAQGKVGSGFDVAAAVYGSCLYRRFTPSILNQLGEAGSMGFSNRLKEVVENTNKAVRWDTEIATKAVLLPKSIRLVMCDVNCGSQTVGMVKKVLAWRAEKADEARPLWTKLQHDNERLAKILSTLSELEMEEPQYFEEDSKAISSDSQGTMGSNIWQGKYQELRDTIAAARASIQAMSSKSSVPIEPPSQTRLLDVCLSVPGVLGGLVPGAGGYDAIALLVLDRADVLAQLNLHLKTWKGEDGDADGSVGKVRPLGVREEMEGIRVEDGRNFSAWLK